MPKAADEVCAAVGHFWINRLIWGRLKEISFNAACASCEYSPATGSWVLVDVRRDAALNEKEEV